MANIVEIKDTTFEVSPGVYIFKCINVGIGRYKVGLIGKNGIGKTTLLRLIVGELMPSSGTIKVNGQVAYLPQDYQIDTKQTVGQVMGNTENHVALAALARLKLQSISLDRVIGTLSGGEKMRIILASLLIKKVDLLILDEPTNNLDQAARRAIYDLVRLWKYGLLVVSHDRTLLNLMDRILDFTDKGIKPYGGNYDFYMLQKKIENEAAQQKLSETSLDLKKTKRQAQKTGEKQQKRSSHGKKIASKLGLPKSILNEMKKHAQQTSGKLKDVHELRVKEAKEKFNKAREKISPENYIYVDLSNTNVPSGKMIVKIEDVSFYYGNKPILDNFSLSMYGPEHLAICGSNGSGKSTLARIILGKLMPMFGSVSIGVDNTAYLDQNVETLDKNKTILENLRLISNLDDILARDWLARFLFTSDDVFKNVGILSGGERIRAALACVLAGDAAPQLIVLDEPTNNLDLDSIERLESALSNYRGTLIVISHDTSFLTKINITREINLK